MLTGMGFTVTDSRLQSIFRYTENQLTEALTKVASGKRVRSPFDNITDYFHAQRFNRDYSDYEKIRTDVADVSAMLNVGVRVGETVYDNLSRMRQLVDDYYEENTTDDEKQQMAAEFNQLIKETNSAIDNTYYDGKKLVQDTSSTGPLKSIYLDTSDLNQKFIVNFSAGQVANPSSLTLGSSDQQSEAASVDAELGKAGSYLASVSAYSRGIKSQYNLLNQKMVNTQAAVSTITDSDESIEMAKATERSIRYQSTAAMIAQANMARASMLKLLNF